MMWHVSCSVKKCGTSIFTTLMKTVNTSLCTFWRWRLIGQIRKKSLLRVRQLRAFAIITQTFSSVSDAMYTKREEYIADILADVR